MKKNTFRKASAIMATAVMAVSASGITASASNGVQKLELTDAQAVAGKTVAVQMKMDTDNTCMCYDLVVEYDSDLVLERVIGAKAFCDFEQGDDKFVSVIGYDTKPYQDDAPVVTFNFTVPEDAQTGDTFEVSFNQVTNFSDLYEDFENYETEDATIEVLEETSRVSTRMVYENEDGSTEVGLRGDVNGDGQVNVRDTATIARHCASAASGNEVIDSETGKYFGNVTESGKISVRDAAAVARYLASGSDWNDILK